MYEFLPSTFLLEMTGTRLCSQSALQMPAVSVSLRPSLSVGIWPRLPPAFIRPEQKLIGWGIPLLSEMLTAHIHKYGQLKAAN